MTHCDTRAAKHTDSPVPPGVARNSRIRTCRQFGLLFRRSWRQVTRDKATAMARLMSNLSSALVFGAIYFRMGRSQSSIQDRLGLLQVRGARLEPCVSALLWRQLLPLRIAAAQKLAHGLQDGHLSCL